MKINLSHELLKNFERFVSSQLNSLISKVQIPRDSNISNPYQPLIDWFNNSFNFQKEKDMALLHNELIDNCYGNMSPSVLELYLNYFDFSSMIFNFPINRDQSNDFLYLRYLPIFLGFNFDNLNVADRDTFINLTCYVFIAGIIHNARDRSVIEARDKANTLFINYSSQRKRKKHYESIDEVFESFNEKLIYDFIIKYNYSDNLFKLFEYYIGNLLNLIMNSSTSTYDKRIITKKIILLLDRYFDIFFFSHKELYVVKSRISSKYVSNAVRIKRKAIAMISKYIRIMVEKDGIDSYVFDETDHNVQPPPIDVDRRDYQLSEPVRSTVHNQESDDKRDEWYIDLVDSMSDYIFPKITDANKPKICDYIKLFYCNEGNIPEGKLNENLKKYLDRYCYGTNNDNIRALLAEAIISLLAELNIIDYKIDHSINSRRKKR